MAEYIDRNEAINALVKLHVETGVKTANAIRVLRELPAASTQPEILACGEGELNVPDTNVGDTISRRLAIDEMEEYWRSLNLRRKRIPLAAEAVYMDLKGVVATLPSAEPERKKGKWIDKPVYMQTMDGKTWDGFTYCSECREIHEYGYRSSFCPNCGAEMTN